MLSLREKWVEVNRVSLEEEWLLKIQSFHYHGSVMTYLRILQLHFGKSVNREKHILIRRMVNNTTYTGVVVGCVVFGVLLLGAVIYLYQKKKWDRTHKPVHPKDQEDELVIGHGIVIHGLHHKDGVGGVDLHHSHGHGHDGTTFKRH